MKIPTEVRLCWDFFLGGAVVSTAPTEQELHHLLGWCSRDCCTLWKALTEQNCTIYFVEGVLKLKYLAN